MESFLLFFFSNFGSNSWGWFFNRVIFTKISGKEFGKFYDHNLFFPQKITPITIFLLRKLATKLLLKCWWNWLHPTFSYYEIVGPYEVRIMFKMKHCQLHWDRRIDVGEMNQPIVFQAREHLLRFNCGREDSLEMKKREEREKKAN